MADCHKKTSSRERNFTICPISESLYPGDYCVKNPITRNEYKVVFRGVDNPWNYCSCMDFKTSRLGTCKHIEAVHLWTEANHKRVYCGNPPYTSVYLSYRGEREIRLRIGSNHETEFRQLAKPYFTPDGRMRPEALPVITDRYPDTELNQLFTVPLYPYQREGIRFAFRAGKSIIADEMGLGKTIQAINMVASNTIEEQMLGTLNFKSSLFEGILDNGADSIFLEDSKFDKMVDSIREVVEKTDASAAANKESAVKPEECEDNADKTNTPPVEEPTLFDNPSFDSEAQTEAPEDEIASDSLSVEGIKQREQEAHPQELLQQGFPFLKGDICMKSSQ